MTFPSFSTTGRRRQVHRPSPPRGMLSWWRAAAFVLLALIPLAPGQESRVAAEAAPDGREMPLRAWHFAEGNSRNGFETFFTLRNLSDQAAGVTAYYNRDDGIRLVQWLGIEPRARLSLKANDVVGPRAFGASFFADQDVVVERSTTWGPGQNGETTVGFAPDGKKMWYFAEGTTRGQTATYFVTQNLTDLPASITAIFVRDDGSRETRAFSLAPRARDAYRVNDLMRDTAFAASFRSDQDIVVERTIMIEGEHDNPSRTRGVEESDKRDAKEKKGFNRNGQAEGETSRMAQNTVGILGGLGYVGVGDQPGSRNWQFAEGSTRAPYRTAFVLFNPNTQGTEVRFQFLVEGGKTRSQTIQVPGLSRAALDPRDLVPAADFATSIMADRPVVVERTYASSGDGLYGALGYTAAAQRSESKDWYFAEGNTTNQIETYFVLLNISDRPAQVNGTYFVDGGAPVRQSLNVPAGGRLAVRANDLVPGSFFSARFLSDRSIVVERTFYLPGGSGFTTVGAGVGS